jgi:hypothetical protein
VRFYVVLAVLFIANSGFLACSNAAQTAEPAEPVDQGEVRTVSRNRVIVKFKDSTIDPSKSEFLKNLSEHAGAKLTHVRAMSGNAHVFVISDMGDTPFSTVLKRLNDYPEVQYAEPDQLMRHMQRVPRENNKKGVQ